MVTPEALFKYASTIAMASWIVMAIAPRWQWTRKIILSGVIPLLLGGLYLVLIVNHFGESEGDFSSLQGVMRLFTNPFAVLAGWIHYLAFDMFIGAWMLSNSQKNNIHHLLVVPCLFFTFMFGPIGLLLYFLVRAIRTKTLQHENF